MAKVDVKDHEHLGHFKVQLKEFHEESVRMLEQVENSVKNARLWLEQDRLPFWKSEIKKRTEKTIQVKNELENAKLRSKGSQNSLVEEKRALKKAEFRLAEAEHKYKRSKAWLANFDKAAAEGLSHIRRLHRDLDQKMPEAISHLNQSIRSLEKYFEA